MIKTGSRSRNAEAEEMSNVATRIVLAAGFSGDENEATLCCPTCGFDYVHIGVVEVFQEKTKTTVSRNRTVVRDLEAGERPSRRGSTVTVRFGCENHHEFSYGFSFHKGNTSVAMTAGEGPLADSLWRD